jgi:C_GCAxxG_C_C family probable redox protein
MSSSNKLVVEKAVKNYQSGYNCAQTVLLTLFEQIEPNSKNELIPKIAAGFAGGMGRCGSVCGALTGSLMAVGIKYGSNEASAEKQAKAYAYVNKLYKQFEKQQGTVYCRDLITHDLSKPEEAAKARQEKAFEKTCITLIKAAVKSFLELEK